MKKLLISVAVFAFAIASFAQAPGYEFTTVVSHKATPVKDQSSTGTCWCFATASFMESELLRMGKGEYDLSEMFIVRQKYMNQMEDNYLRRGKGNIGEGSLAHTFKNAYKQVGIVPEEAYSGLIDGNKEHNHGALSRYFKALVDANMLLKSVLRNIMHLSIICSIRIWVNCRRNSLIKERNIHRSLSPKAWD